MIKKTKTKEEPKKKPALSLNQMINMSQRNRPASKRVESQPPPQTQPEPLDENKPLWKKMEDIKRMA